MVVRKSLGSVLDLDATTLALIAPHVPEFQFVLDDLSRVSDRDLRARSLTALARAGLLLLSRGRSSTHLLDDMRRWLDVLGQVTSARNGVEALSAVLEYAFRVGEVSPQDLHQLARQLGPTAEQAYMTAAQKLTAESYARGKAEGKAELLLQLLERRFAPLPQSVVDEVLRATPERLDTLAERVISAQSLEEFLR